jgi:simple sugar transport system substrate-binding protein
MMLLKLLSALLIYMLMTLAPTAVMARDYRFVMVSHIGAQDPNMNWLTLSLADFEKRYPNVSTEYIGGLTPGVDELVRNLKEAMASRPDGIAVPILDVGALEGPIREALAMGIPVVAFNIPDNRPPDQRIPYLTYVGGDEYLTGFKIGLYALAKAEEGIVPMPKKVVCTLHTADHAGLRERCRGIEDAFRKIGASVEYLITDIEQARFRRKLKTFLSSNSDTNYIFNLADFTAAWSWKVANELGMEPDVDTKGMTVLTVDVGPIGLSGVKNGHLLVASEQGFWLQGYIPMEWLYWYHEMGYRPQSDIITGPVLVDKDNLEQMDKLSRLIFGVGSEGDSAWRN